MTQDIDQLAINTIRTLSMDAVQKANSGHPGTPMSLAPVAYELWQNHLRYDPANPVWPNRDRFVLSAGHASMLLYSMIFLAGVRKVDADYNVTDEPACSLEEIENFRQLHSRTPGHPEYRWTTGVETTTGPLGQGVGTSVGMAMASKWLGATYGAELFDFDTYARRRRRLPAGGDLARSRLARRPPEARQPLLDLRQQPHLDRRRHRAGLQRRRPQPLRGLRLERDPGRRRQRRAAARQSLQRVQGRGRPPDPDRRRQPHRLGLAEQAGHRVRPRRTARRRGDRTDEGGLRLAEGRQVPRPRRRPRALRRGDRHSAAPRRTPHGSRSSTPSRAAIPSKAAELEMMQRRGLPDGWDADLPSFEADEEKGLATRKASNKVQNAIAAKVPWLIAGSCDLTDSTSVRLSDADQYEPGSYDGRQVHFGIREHAAAAACNGMSTAKLRPLWSTYLTFSDYGQGRDPPLGADGAAGRPPLHPRLDRARRGRPDPPADRAARRPAGDAAPRRDPPRRRQRGDRGLEGRARTAPTTRSRW